MTMNTFMQWFFIMGTITVVIGMYRYLKNKQNTEPDELTTLSWFFAWWVWLPFLAWRLFYTKILKK